MLEQKDQKNFREVLELFCFKGAREGVVHMGRLAKIGCEGERFNFKKLNCINVKIV